VANADSDRLQGRADAIPGERAPGVRRRLADGCGEDVVNAKGISQKIIRCLKFDGTSIFFKLRLLTYTAFPSILKPIFWLKKFLRKYQ
jgi:hypothetical protein